MNAVKFLTQYRLDLPRLLGLACLYALLAKIVLSMALTHNNLTVLWLPGGLGLAALLVYGKKYWVGVFAGAFFAGILVGDTVWISAPIALGNTLESLLGAWLLTRSGKFDLSLNRLSDYFRLLLVAGMMSTPVSAVIGVTALLQAGFITWQAYPLDFLRWWLGDALGIVLLTPMLLVWRQPPSHWSRRSLVLEGVPLLALTLLSGQIIFCGLFSESLGQFGKAFMMFIFGAWAAIRFGRHGLSIILSIVLMQGIYGVAHGVGYFGKDMTAGLVNFWLYYAEYSVLSMLLALSMSERRKVEQNLLVSDQRYRSLIHNASDAIVIADMHGNIDEINLRAEKLLGYSCDEICGSSVSKIHHAEDMPRVRQHFEDIYRMGNVEPLETKIVRQDGSVVEIEVRPTLVEIGGRKLVQGIFIDLTQRKQHERVRLAAEKTHRDTLVREVHHRIKNNLQGVIGVLRQFAEHHPELKEPLNQAISQVQSVSVIHGLQGRTSLVKVRVCELTLAIASGIESLWQKPVIVNIPDGWIPCTIDETEAVPIALVLNELILNAIKHGAQGDQVIITFSHEPRPESIRLTIQNTGLMPIELDAKDASTLGTGLQLVVSLLPRAGARLSWVQHEDTVTTILELDTPVIYLEPVAASIELYLPQHEPKCSLQT